VSPLTPLTDATAQSFEAGSQVDTSDLQPNMRTALSCVQDAVTAQGGTLSIASAYRPSAYQAHLREVWDKHALLANNRTPQCAGLKAAIDKEFSKARHGLLVSQRPASPTGPHTRGDAIDMTSSLPLSSFLSIASQCGLYRRLPSTDPVHYEHK